MCHEFWNIKPGMPHHFLWWKPYHILLLVFNYQSLRSACKNLNNWPVKFVNTVVLSLQSFSKFNQYMATYMVNQQALSYEPFLCILALHTKCKPIQIVYDKWLKWRTFISKSHYSIVCVPKIVINLAFIREQ